MKAAQFASARLPRRYPAGPRTASFAIIDWAQKQAERALAKGRDPLPWLAISEKALNATGHTMRNAA